MIQTFFKFILILIITISSCKQLGLEKVENDKTPILVGLAILNSQRRTSSVSQSEVVSRYADIAFASYSDSVTDANKLKAAIDTFVGASIAADVSTPTQANFEAARTAWLNARPSYLQTEAFRFSNGPINEKLETRLPDAETETLINAWPMDELFLDCVITNTATTAGLDEARLLNVNGLTTVPSCTTFTDSAKNISLGWHAVEYLLWGVDTAGNLTSGNRAVGDFQGAVLNSVQQKRRQYLRTVTKLLVDHITLVRDRWDSTKSNNFISGFKSNTSKSISDIFTGLSRFSKSEWGGERLKINTSNDQEDEHSCFSDNTKSDFYYDAQGVINVFSGTYKNSAGSTTTGAGLKDLAGSLQSKLDTNLTESRNAFCLNVSGVNMTLDSTTCPTATNSITTKYDNMSAGDKTKLNNLQTLIGVTISNDIQSIARNNGISFTAPTSLR
jgi:putative iron-regulated protein